ncbi:MAG: hypothetical protein KatS3mg063_1910 [Tepidiforma sp.]|nr:MAG: hypothetical protein KatS3mg063_1910 [Tepidiforma sp.]
MPTILAAAASGLVHNQDILDTVAHNLANANTSGFKAFRALHQGLPDAAATADSGRLGVAVTTRDLLLTPAAVIASDSPLHAALQDDAFFVIRGEAGEPVYTRYGGFLLDGKGTLVDFAGRIVPGENGDPIRLPAGWSAAMPSTPPASSPPSTKTASARSSAASAWHGLPTPRASKRSATASTARPRTAANRRSRHPGMRVLPHCGPARSKAPMWTWPRNSSA